MPIRILLVDDHSKYRAAIREMLEQEPDLEIVAEAGDGAGAIRLDAEKTPDVIIMDIAMANLDGIEATRRILARRPAARVLVLTLHSDTRFVEAMFEVGAVGYVLKQDCFAELANAVREVAAGRTYFSPNIASPIAPIDDGSAQ